MASRVAALLLLGVVCIGFAAGEVVADCCLLTTPKFFPLNRISDYILQEAGKGCDKSATVFITKTGRRVCVVHPREKGGEWVQSHINHLERRKGKQ